MTIVSVDHGWWASLAVDHTGLGTTGNAESTELIRRDEGWVHSLDVVVCGMHRKRVGNQRLDGDSSHTRVW